MEEQGTEAKVLSKDEERKLRLQQERELKAMEAKFQEEKAALKKDVEIRELWVKFYQYSLALPELERRYIEMQEQLRHKDIQIEKNPEDLAEENNGTEVEETPVVELKKE